jgi:aspartyl-tRNA(Asn)/glutamyl-tRNA(Gln) amidotransferase subunit A
VRYGHRAAEYKTWPTCTEDPRRRLRCEVSAASWSAPMLCHGYYDAYYLKAQKIRRLIAQDFSR